jgi:hypothetical protein
VKLRHGILGLSLLLGVTACNKSETNEVVPTSKNTPAQAKKSGDAVAAAAEAALGTPMAERIAVLGILNKRNGDTRNLELKPGQYIRMGKVEVRLRACEKTAPWETYPDEGAFVQLVVFERPAGNTEKPSWRQVFSGWLFKNNPAANVIQHPIYDVWVKECKMSFPGDEETPEPRGEPAEPDSPAAKKPSNAPQSAVVTEPGDVDEPAENGPREN